MSAQLTSTPDLAVGARSFVARGVAGHVIDGVTVESRLGGTLDVVDPSTGLVVMQSAKATQDDVDAAVAAARRAFDDGRWSGMPPLARERVLRRFADLIEERGADLADLDSLDAGVLSKWCSYIVSFTVEALQYNAGWPSKLEGSIPPVGPDFTVLQQKAPLGVVAAIMPWNGPTAVWAGVSAALAAGCTVILKPAEQTPLTATYIGELAQQAGFPAGVVNVLQGDGSAGAALVSHPGVDAVSFTGSAETGRRIAAAAAPTLKHVSLELGGKSPFIVFDDADIANASVGAMASVWGNSGQVCTAGTRTLVQRGIYDDFVASLVRDSESLTVGSAFDASSDLGPLITREQLSKVQTYIEVGQQEGADLRLGGVTAGSGGFLQAPTIFAGVRNDMRIAQEEIFGPVMSVIPFDTEDEAYRIANDTQYGLAAGVWTNDLSRAHRASNALRAGTVWINTYQATNPAVSYGGWKQSGYGRNLGGATVESFTHLKSMWMAVGK
jgi:acyl-CoA reductase-like NAD-dependent aldehyde dehydrogenase